MLHLSSDRSMTVLTGATVAGMGLAACDAFAVPGPWGPAGLALAYLAGGLPAAALWHEGGTVLVVLNGLRLLADPIRSDRKRA
ncbi:hypothetical protein ACFFJ7_05315 [Pseudochelatococcus lubricantis]|uniref:hypothetical protein n=1 Tax=Pseudochelatococcus lubricantis TaxID=1538102 RepID=UPI0035F029A3